MNPMSRRQFFALSSALALAPRTAFSIPAKPKICVFTKALQELSYDELADRIADHGFQGIEAPIRNGGHIEPERVDEELPKMVEALKKRDLEITIMASSVNSLSQPLTEKTLRVASSLGIQRYRMQYFIYESDKPIQKQLNEWKPQLKDLAALNRELGIQALYQNHAGAKYFGSALWDLEWALRGIPKKEIGVAYDIRHATVEGGLNWPTTFRLLRPKIAALYMKDFVWNGANVENTPLGAGRVDYPRLIEMVQSSEFSGPISLHVEYIDHRDPKLIPDHLKAMAKDLETLKGYLNT